jgi:hypothetical protein
VLAPSHSCSCTILTRVRALFSEALVLSHIRSCFLTRVRAANRGFFFPSRRPLCEQLPTQSSPHPHKRSTSFRTRFRVLFAQVFVLRFPRALVSYPSGFFRACGNLLPFFI